MIRLVLNDLCRPAGECFYACLHFHGLILHLDHFVSLAFAETAEKRETTFFGVVCAVLLKEYRIVR